MRRPLGRKQLAEIVVTSALLTVAACKVTVSDDTATKAQQLAKPTDIDNAFMTEAMTSVPGSKYQPRQQNEFGSCVSRREARTAADGKARDARFRRITWHHTPVPGKPKITAQNELHALADVKQVHLSQKFGDFGYHYLIGPSGKVYEGRSLGCIGYGAFFHNGVMCNEAKSASSRQKLETLKTKYGGSYDLEQLCEADTANLHIAMLGCFHEAEAGDRDIDKCPLGSPPPTAAALDSLVKLTAALAYYADIPLKNGDTLRGHWQLNYDDKSNACTEEICDHHYTKPDGTRSEIYTVCPGSLADDHGVKADLFTKIEEELKKFSGPSPNPPASPAPTTPTESTSSGANTGFNDVTDAKQKTWLAGLQAKIFLKGCSEGRFCPDQPLLGEQAAYLLLRLRDSKGTEDNPRDLGSYRSAACGKDTSITEATLWSDADCPEPTKAVTQQQLLAGLRAILQHKDGDSKRDEWFRATIADIRSTCGTNDDTKALNRIAAVCFLYEVGEKVKTNPALSFPSSDLISQWIRAVEKGKTAVDGLVKPVKEFLHGASPRVAANQSPLADQFRLEPPPLDKLPKASFTKTTQYIRKVIDVANSSGAEQLRGQDGKPFGPKLSKADLCATVLNGTTLLKLPGGKQETYTVIPTTRGDIQYGCDWAGRFPKTDKRPFFAAPDPFGVVFATNTSCGGDAQATDCFCKYRAVPDRTVVVCANHPAVKAGKWMELPGNTNGQRAVALYIPKLKGLKSSSGKPLDGWVLGSDRGSYCDSSPEQMDYHAGDAVGQATAEIANGFDAYVCVEGNPACAAAYEALVRQATIMNDGSHPNTADQPWCIPDA